MSRRRVLNSQFDMFNPNAARPGPPPPLVWTRDDLMYTVAELTCGALDVVITLGGDTMRLPYQEWADENELTRDLLAIGVALGFIRDHRATLKACQGVASPATRAVEIVNQPGDFLVTEKQKRLLARLRQIQTDHHLRVEHANTKG